MLSETDREWIDGRGCLTDTALAALATAPPGTSPPGVAAHLAECQRCQYRLLSGREPGARPSRETQQLWQRLWAVVVVVTLAAVSLLFLGWWLTRAG
jgi:hypothetical protein